ncbi:23661_t:CDS:2 [Cetraspora pellucida]|uniref:23661_t:CDS:1 n=1 Tax=Cetraspora pellucida TaxID=1433469 RepID=A0A9N9HHY0_9GLOM|nr:23661_t:CDS:2 [Cetraspora pellucida]
MSSKDNQTRQSLKTTLWQRVYDICQQEAEYLNVIPTHQFVSVLTDLNEMINNFAKYIDENHDKRITTVKSNSRSENNDNAIENDDNTIEHDDNTIETNNTIENDDNTIEYDI